MSVSSHIPDILRFGGTRRLVPALLLMAAASIAGWLAWRSVGGDGGMAGCGAGGGCSRVLLSPYAFLGGFPVSVFGLVLYLTALVAVWKGRSGLSVLTAMAILAGAGWFVAVQALILKAWCPWCSAAHALASAAALFILTSWKRRLLLPGLGKSVFLQRGIPILLLSGALGLLQTLAPRRELSRFHASSSGDFVQKVSLSVPGLEKMSISDGRVLVDGAALPVISAGGELSADRGLVLVLSDWSCPFCRELHGRLRGGEGGFRTFLLVPAWRDDTARELHRLMLTAWLGNSSAYDAAAVDLTAGTLEPTPAALRARFVVDSEEWRTAEAALSPQVARILETGASLLAASDARLDSSTLPQLISPAGTLVGSPSASALQEFLKGPAFHPENGPATAPHQAVAAAETTELRRLLLISRAADPAGFQRTSADLVAGTLPLKAEAVRNRIVSSLGVKRLEIASRNLSATIQPVLNQPFPSSPALGDFTAVDLLASLSPALPRSSGPEGSGAGGAPPGAVAPALVWDSREVRMSPVTQGAVSHGTAKFRNSRKEPVSITGVHTACGCTSVSEPRQTIAPGAAGELKFDIDTTRLPPGELTKNVIVNTNQTGSDARLVIALRVRVEKAVPVSPNTGAESSAAVSPPLVSSAAAR